MNVESVFENKNHVYIHSAIVIVSGRKERYIVYSYFDKSSNINFNLSEICPQNPWKGELIVFSLGKRVRLLSRPSGPKTTLERAIKW